MAGGEGIVWFGARLGLFFMYLNSSVFGFSALFEVWDSLFGDRLLGVLELRTARIRRSWKRGVEGMDIRRIDGRGICLGGEGWHSGRVGRLGRLASRRRLAMGDSTPWRTIPLAFRSEVSLL